MSGGTAELSELVGLVVDSLEEVVVEVFDFEEEEPVVAGEVDVEILLSGANDAHL